MNISKSNVLSIYDIYLKELIKFTLIYAQTNKVTQNGSCNNTFCFTRSNIASKLYVAKITNNAQINSLTYRRPVLYNFC